MYYVVFLNLLSGQINVRKNEKSEIETTNGKN